MKKVDEIKSDLLNTLILHIKDKGMTQQKIGDVLGVHQSRVSNLVNGRLDLFSLDNLVHICLRLGLTVTVKVKEDPKRSVRRYTGKPIKGG